MLGSLSFQSFITVRTKLVDLRDIKAIIDLMKKNSISEFELERQEFKIKLKRCGPQGLAGGGVITEIPASVTVPATSQPAQIPPAVPGNASLADDAKAGIVEIKSPMIGTLYSAASPDSPNYVEIGSEVGPDTVVCIIEAMKVMNEIKAEVKGVIVEILVENAKPVEFGQPLFKVRPK